MVHDLHDAPTTTLYPPIVIHLVNQRPEVGEHDHRWRLTLLKELEIRPRGNRNPDERC